MKIDNSKLQTQIRSDIANKITTDILRKKLKEGYQPDSTYNEDLFEEGVEWFISGLSLEDAPEDKLKNTNFSKGFKKAQRLDMINTMIYNDGYNFYINGGSLEVASDKMRNNEHFVRGFNDAKKMNKQK